MRRSSTIGDLEITKDRTRLEFACQLNLIHDGTYWLIKAYCVYSITAASLADLNTTPTNAATVRVLAAAFTEGNFEVTVGDRTVRYNGLLYTGPEVETLVSLIPNTVQRLNAAFYPDILYEMDDTN